MGRAFTDGEASWALVTGPQLWPIELVDAKDHARITQPQGQASIERYLRAATEEAEATMSRGLLTQTWKLNLRCWADKIYLPRAAPLQSVTSVKYYDTTGTQQTLATTYYDVDTISRPGSVVRKPQQSYPALQSDRQAPRIEILYVIGWTSADLVPERIKQGIRIYITWLDRNRDGMNPDAKNGCPAAAACWTDIVPWIYPVNCA